MAPVFLSALDEISWWRRTCFGALSDWKLIGMSCNNLAFKKLNRQHDLLNAFNGREGSTLDSFTLGDLYRLEVVFTVRVRMAEVMERGPERSTKSCYSWHGELQTSPKCDNHIPKQREMAIVIIAAMWLLFKTKRRISKSLTMAQSGWQLGVSQTWYLRNVLSSFLDKVSWLVGASRSCVSYLRRFWGRAWDPPTLDKPRGKIFSAGSRTASMAGMLRLWCCSKWCMWRVDLKALMRVQCMILHVLWTKIKWKGKEDNNRKSLHTWVQIVIGSWKFKTYSIFPTCQTSFMFFTKAHQHPGYTPRHHIAP